MACTHGYCLIELVFIKFCLISNAVSAYGIAHVYMNAAQPFGQRKVVQL